MESLIAKSLKQVIEKVNAALKNSTKTKRCTIVGASKTKPLELLKEAYDAGLRHFGENYVDEIVTKSPALPQDIKWHYIGHLQSNKIKQVLVPNLYMLETIDSSKLAAKVQKEVEKQKRKLKVLIQVKTSTEQTKSGVSPDDAPALIEFILTQCPNLEFSGLMTIGYEGDENAFIQLYDLKLSICEKFKFDQDEIELSMGMSQDFERAVLFGSTNVRVGTNIFGAREYPMKALCKEEHILVGETETKEKKEEKPVENKEVVEEQKINSK